MTENEIAKHVVDVAYKIHTTLGPGLLETVYKVVLAREFRKRGLAVERQVPVQIIYEGIKFEEGLRADLIVDGKVIVELKFRRKCGACPQKTVADSSSADRSSFGAAGQLWRGTDQGWYFA